jgi:hypothetical protein
MHSLIQPDLARVVADDRVETARRRAVAGRPEHPPPVRSRAAYATARLARRLDQSAARRAVV